MPLQLENAIVQRIPENTGHQTMAEHLYCGGGGRGVRSGQVAGQRLLYIQAVYISWMFLHRTKILFKVAVPNFYLLIYLFWISEPFCNPLPYLQLFHLSQVIYIYRVDWWPDVCGSNLESICFSCAVLTYMTYLALAILYLLVTYLLLWYLPYVSDFHLPYLPPA